MCVILIIVFSFISCFITPLGIRNIGLIINFTVIHEFLPSLCWHVLCGRYVIQDKNAVDQRFSLVLDKYSDDLLSEQPYYSSFQLQVMQENLEHDIIKVLEDF